MIWPNIQCRELVHIPFKRCHIAQCHTSERDFSQRSNQDTEYGAITIWEDNVLRVMSNLEILTKVELCAKAKHFDPDLWSVLVMHVLRTASPIWAMDPLVASLMLSLPCHWMSYCCAILHTCHTSFFMLHRMFKVSFTIKPKLAFPEPELVCLRFKQKTSII